MSELKTELNKNELLEKLNAANLSPEQINEINMIANGEPSHNQIAEKIIDLLSKAAKDHSGLWYKGIVLLMFFGFIGLLAYHFPNSETQVWSLVGTLIGFVFGQKSQLLNL